VNQVSPLAQLINVYSFIVLARVIVSWIQLPPNNPIVYYSRMLTEPLLEPIRKLLPAGGGLDFSPILVFLLITVIEGIIGRI